MGCNLTRFMDDYSTKAQCVAAPFRWRGPMEFACLRYEHSEFRRLPSPGQISPCTVLVPFCWTVEGCCYLVRMDIMHNSTILKSTFPL